MRMFKRNCRICTAPKARDVTSPVLDHTSGHSTAVTYWPLGFLKSQLRLCSEAQDRGHVAEQIVERFRFQGTPPAVLRALEGVDPDAPLTKTVRRRPCSSGTVWLTTDFHPILQGELQGVARKFLESGESTLLQNMSGQSAPKDIRISFRNGRMNLQDVANSMGRKAGVPEVDRPIAV